MSDVFAVVVLLLLQPAVDCAFTAFLFTAILIHIDIHAHNCYIIYASYPYSDEDNDEHKNKYHDAAATHDDDDDHNGDEDDRYAHDHVSFEYEYE